MCTVCLWCALAVSPIVHSPEVGVAWRFHPAYRVHLHLIEIQSDGNRIVIEAPQITTLAGTTVEVPNAGTMKPQPPITLQSIAKAEESETPQQKRCQRNLPSGNYSWQVQLQQVQRKNANLNLRVQKHHDADSTNRGVLVDGKSYVLREEIQLDEIHRVVLTRDNNGVATSWVEILVEENQNKPSVLPAKMRQGQTRDVEVYPFYYEPF